jgi:phage gp36-like protein
MAAYANSADLRERVGGAIYQEIYGTTPNAAADDLVSAAAEIDGAAAVRYKLPVSGAGTLALFRDWNLTLAEERAFARPAGAAYTEKVKSRVAQVREYLKMLREGTFRLPDAPELGAGAGGVALVQCDEPVFGRDKMRGY